MNCYFHPEEVSVASCVDCGKGLCKICAGKYQIAICDECNQRRNTSDKKAAVKRIIPSFILFVIGAVGGFILTGMDPPSPFDLRVLLGITMGWGLAGTVWGWLFTRKWFPPKVYVKTGSGLDANDFFHSARPVIRMILAIPIGMVAMPIELVKLILTFSKAKKISKTINTNMPSSNK